MAFYPKSTLMVEQTKIYRDRVLPPGVFGQVAVNRNESVQPHKIVVHGERQQDFQIIDVANQYGIKPDNIEKLAELIAVQPGEAVEEGQILVNVKGRRAQKKAPHAPAHGSVSMIDNGRIILQINPVPVQIAARIPGRVIDVIGNRGVRIETAGTLIQCMWGNGKFTYGGFGFEPEEGLAEMAARDSRLEGGLRGRIFILERELTPTDIEVALKNRAAGLVAITMPYELQSAAEMVDFPILLTDGFGKRRPSERIFNLLRRYAGRNQAAFDAHTPGRWQSDRPEIIIPSASQEANPPSSADTPLRIGMRVRVSRAPHQGAFGEITGLPDSPEAMDNGLRTSVARVKLDSGQTHVIALDNVEILS